MWGGVDKDFEDIEADSRQKNQDQDWKDFNNELAGQDSGRVPRFGIKAARDSVEVHKKRDAKFRELLDTHVYDKAWNSTLNVLIEAENSVYDALRDASDKLLEANKHHRALLDQAAVLPSGEQVFLADTDTAYKVSGEELSSVEFSSVNWIADQPSWNDYQVSLEQLKSAQTVYDQTDDYSQRLVNMRDEIETLEGENTVQAYERLEELSLQAKKITSAVNLQSSSEREFEVTTVSPSSVPDLGL